MAYIILFLFYLDGLGDQPVSLLQVELEELAVVH
jgi:hypothetical protein